MPAEGIYDDLMIRSFLGDQGVFPTQGTITHSPDVIPYGIAPVSDPDTTFRGNWKSDVGKNLECGQVNYIYLRGMNLAPGAESGKAYLYYVPCQIINWPSLWKDNLLQPDIAKPGGERQDYIEISADSHQDIFVGIDPFSWAPDPPPPGSNHYCLISRIETDSHPNPLPDPGDFTVVNMVELVHDNRGYAWRNVVIVDQDQAPDWTRAVAFSTEQDLKGILVVLAINGDLIGCDVAFSCGTTQGVHPPPLAVPRQTVVEPNQVIGKTVDVDAGFDSYINVSLWSQGKEIKPGDGMALKALVESDGSDRMNRLALPHEAHGISALEGIGPTWCVSIGDFHFKYK